MIRGTRSTRQVVAVIQPALPVDLSEFPGYSAHIRQALLKAAGTLALQGFALRHFDADLRFHCVPFRFQHSFSCTVAARAIFMKGFWGKGSSSKGLHSYQDDSQLFRCVDRGFLL